MAGRIVILQFDDRKEADAALDLMGEQVMAVFVKPSKFCECPDKRRQNASNWAKGKRTGLYICKVCKRPSIHHQQGMMDRLKYVFGKNLLEG